MFVAGQKEMQQLDQYTIEKIGLPGIVLMENAGERVVEEIMASAPCHNPVVLVLAGGGNNGGDGFVIARRLFDLDVQVHLCLISTPNGLKGDAKVHYDVYINRGLPISFYQDNSNIFMSHLQQADILIDAIFGTGINRLIREPYDQVIHMVNEYAGKKLIISVDIPSGLNSDNGKVQGVAVKADKTITFVFPKTGFFLNDGPMHVGEWKAVDISVPKSIVHDLGIKMPNLITENLVKASIPLRPHHGHKGTFGHVLVVGGSRSFVGAPVFTAKAVLHSGAGLATLAIPENIYSIAANISPEALFLPLSETDGHFDARAILEISPRLGQFTSIAIGPGMSRFPGGEAWIESFIQHLNGQPIVVDADALYLFRNQLEIIREYQGDVLFSPHPGEMANLLHTSIKEVEENRLEVATSFAKKYEVYLLLKGHRPIIATPAGNLYINPFGHDALGKGGSGDVLTGVIASFLSQGASPTAALVSASYLHAKAGEDKARMLSHYGVMPMDIIEGIRDQLVSMERK